MGRAGKFNDLQIAVNPVHSPFTENIPGMLDTWLSNGITGRWISPDSYLIWLKHMAMGPIEGNLAQADFEYNDRDDDLVPGYTNDPRDPRNYKTVARFCFNLAAIFGNVAIDNRRLDLAAGQAENGVVSGMKSAEWLSYGNEPSRYWQGVQGYHDAMTLAAKISAWSDGHGGYIG